MQLPTSTRLLALALCTSGVLLGAGPNGCGPVQDTDPLPEPPPECGAVCAIDCEHGNVLDAAGCPTCACNPPPLCLSDADCAVGSVCDTTVCLSRCAPDMNCPAVCYGECTAGQPQGCDPAAEGACGDGYACLCREAASDRIAAPGQAPRPESCTCEAVEPPPPACDPTAADACGAGASCVCPLSGASDAAPCTGEGCLRAPPTDCYCEPNPPTCDPTSRSCLNGGECVCYGTTRPACGPDDAACDPMPSPECFCVEPPPPPTCGPTGEVCPDGSVCECSVSTSDRACDPDDSRCGPVEPVCQCVPVAPPTCGEQLACPDGYTCQCYPIDCADPNDCPPQPWCECVPLPPPPSCGPSGEICPEGFACVCTVSDCADPTGRDCGAPLERCGCEPTNPPVDRCDPTAPMCPAGTECFCAVSTPVECPPGRECGPTPAPECYCMVPPLPPPPASCSPTDPNAPVCGPNEDCVCVTSGLACDPNDPMCVPPPDTTACTCVGREPARRCNQDSDCAFGQACYALDACPDDGLCGYCR